MKEISGILSMAFMFYCIERGTGDEEGLVQESWPGKRIASHRISKPLFSLLLNYYCVLKMIMEANLDDINTLNLTLHKTDSFMKGVSFQLKGRRGSFKR